MAKPNRVIANMSKRDPVDQRTFRSWADATAYATAKAAEGFEVRATRRHYGPRRSYREFNVFVYEKMRRGA